MKRKGMFRMAAVFLAMALCVTAFSVTALASGGEDTAEVTGGMEPDSSESETATRVTQETETALKRMISWNRSPPCLAAWGMYLLTVTVSGSLWTRTGARRPGP